MIWPPPFSLSLAFLIASPSYKDQRRHWSTENQTWYPEHPARTQQGPMRFLPFNLSSAVKLMSSPAVVSLCMPLFGCSKELAGYLGMGTGWRFSLFSSSLLWELLWKTTPPPSSADKSCYVGVGWEQKYWTADGSANYRQTSLTTNAWACETVQKMLFDWRKNATKQTNLSLWFIKRWRPIYRKQGTNVWVCVLVC